MEIIILSGLFVLGSIVGVWAGGTIAMRKPAQCSKHSATRREMSQV